MGIEGVEENGQHKIWFQLLRNFPPCLRKTIDLCEMMVNLL